ncbi:GyrI-like domain-containing protein [Microbacterium hydrocarbonoxydans]|uniref:GyrI-like domain-containing protein n=1 Tax=Microbacterium hydrocarbonoxydans TaxID=273678 RepID=UPI00204006E6|nr:GyrI-like domain-containing protein [Microbacterium hydrocarbonoxydans]MCM3781081.1 GyrI-like domain-containing protein [Microbacterium hydrocarbonoxydans]
MAFEIHDGPRIETRPERQTLGIRIVTPFRGMLAVRDSLIAELSAWLAARRIEVGGPFFLRLHTVDMAGDMEIEVGVLDASVVSDDDRVRTGSAPAGDYAIIAYRGSSMQANKTLLAWAPEQGRRFDTDPASGRWGGRFEILRADPRKEPRKTAWTVELAFLVKPET